MEVECSCKHYEAYGLLCRHKFYVLRMNNSKEFPLIYLNERWLKNAKSFNVAVRRIFGGSDSILESEVSDLYEIFESQIDLLVHDMDKLKIYKEQMKNLLNKAITDVPTVPKLNSKDVFSVTLGIKEPTSKTIRNLDHSSNKGNGVHSRWKSKAKIEKEAAQKIDKRRTCSVCRNKEGSFGDETDEITDLHQDSPRSIVLEHGDGVVGIKRHRRNLSGDGFLISVTTSQCSRLKVDLEPST
uniref:SWIM-type domain-containing protein n=1 Tax=Tanacetum cinerariifolium TaxID=118510 RepID=A0A6L2MDF6_TANCI|nr:hypothetical protein [Tanacetum cinerariifolium]